MNFEKKQSGCPNLAVCPNIPDFTLLWLTEYRIKITIEIAYMTGYFCRSVYIMGHPDLTISIFMGISIDSKKGYTVKRVLSGHSKIDKTKVLKPCGSLMQVKRIAECSLWSILRFFWPTLSDNWSWKPIFGLFENGCLRQISLYPKLVHFQSKFCKSP